MHALYQWHIIELILSPDHICEVTNLYSLECENNVCSFKSYIKFKQTSYSLGHG